MRAYDDFRETVEVAGIRDQSGEYHDYEDSLYIPNDHDLIEADQIVISYRDAAGDVHHTTIRHGVDGWDGLEDALHDIFNRYED